MARCKCGVRIWKGSQCGNCRQKQIEEMYGLSFGDGNRAIPSEKFWRAWRADRDWVKKHGLRPDKSSGKWVVVRAQRLM